MSLAQWGVVALVGLNFLASAHIAYRGHQEIKPRGFPGMLSSMLGAAFRLWLFWQAGLFRPYSDPS